MLHRNSQLVYAVKIMRFADHDDFFNKRSTLIYKNKARVAS